MPSEDRVTPILRALAGSRRNFHSAAVAAAGEIEAYLGSRRVPTSGRGQLVAAELGAFGAGRIDPDRFAALLMDESPLEEGAAAQLDRALSTLRAMLRDGEALFRTEVPPGRDAAPAVEAALAVVGRAFGAARIAERVRTGRAASVAKDDPAGNWPFARWNRAERLIAPPLVVEIDGGDLVPGGLAAYLDGAQKLALVVRGAAPPAALVRLITPGVFVMQTEDPADFARFAAFEGPAIAALVPEGCALFVHDPAAGATFSERITIRRLPDEPPRKAVGRSSPFVQAEELALLESLAATGAAAPAQAMTATTAVKGGPASTDGRAPTPAGSAGAASPADVLAAWLLTQADLTDAGA